MTQEDKQLLLQDLCTRLPYRVKLKVREWKTPVELTIVKHNVLSGNYIINENYRLDDIKPYLRPISSMTEEEKEELRVKNIIIGVSTSGTIETTIQGMDWLNEKMFDYRGLIPKGLALSTEIYNPYKD